MKLVTSDLMFAGFLTMTGVLLGIYAAESNVRLDWPETALVAGVVLVTVGVIKLLREVSKDEQSDD